MLHLANLPTMTERLNILQAQFLFRSLYVPNDSFLGYLLPSIQHARGYQWHALSDTALWKQLPAPLDCLTVQTFRSAKKAYMQQRLQQQMNGYGSKLLSLCRPKLSIYQFSGYPWPTKSIVVVFVGVLTACLEENHVNVPNILLVCLLDHMPLHAIRHISDYVSRSSSWIPYRFFSISFLRVLAFLQGMLTLGGFIGWLSVPFSLK